MEKTQNLQKTISKWTVISTVIITAVLALVVGGMFTWFKIDPKGYWKHINTPIVEWRMKNLRANLIACNKEYGADKYLLDNNDVNIGKDRIVIDWEPGSDFLPSIVKLNFIIFGSTNANIMKNKPTIVSSIRDISPLHGMRLKNLNLSYTAVHNLKPLRGMPLVKLALPNISNTKIPKEVLDISPLKGMKLIDLSIENCQVKGISALQTMPLGYLWLKNTPISDISPLSKLKTLKLLSIIGTKIVDLSPLYGTGITILLYRGEAPKKGYIIGPPEEMQKYLNQSKKKR